MSIKIMSALWEAELGSPTTKLVALCLADHANDVGECYPAISTIARKTGCDERTVQRHIRKLEEAGIVSREDGAGRKGANIYTVIAPPAACHPSPRQPATPPPGSLPPKPSLEPSDKNPPTPQGGDCGSSHKTPFDDFWAVVWEKKNRASAERAWNRLSEANRKKAIGFARQFFQRWREDYPQASPIHPSTYLNGKRWEDLGAVAMTDQTGGPMIVSVDEFDDKEALKARGITTMRDPNVIWFSVAHGWRWIRWSSEAREYEYLDAPPDGYTETGKREDGDHADGV